MKTVFTAMLMVVAVASPAMAQQTVPFRGTLQAAEVDADFQFPLAEKGLEGTGQASHLGRFTLVANFAVDVTNLTAAGTFTMTAANGDNIVGTSFGVGSLDGATASITETYTITGGTGRFDGASGTIVIWRVLATATGLSAGVMDGVIAFGQ